MMMVNVGGDERGGRPALGPGARAPRWGPARPGATRRGSGGTDMFNALHSRLCVARSSSSKHIAN